MKNMNLFSALAGVNLAILAASNGDTAWAVFFSLSASLAFLMYKKLP